MKLDFGIFKNVIKILITERWSLDRGVGAVVLILSRSQGSWVREGVRSNTFFV